MIVYLVTEGEPYEGSSVVAAYSKEKHAERHVKDLVNKSDGYMEYSYEEFRVLDMPGDKLC